jgi:hypothetical protein
MKWNMLVMAGVAIVIFAADWRIQVQTGFTSKAQAVTTYHNDNLRTGWNSNESVLTPTNVNTETFGLLHSVALDAQVDSQPLVVPNVTITAGQYQGLHNVVYVATENNTIYAIDASSGVVLLQSGQLGVPVNIATCSNNSPSVGITSTPVINVASNTIYAMAYSSVSGAPTYTLYALDLGNLQDKAQVIVTASHTLAGGSTYTFNATVERQRPALLLANGNVYAAFGSFCDHNQEVARGWVLGWNAGTLTPLPHNILTDTQTKPQSGYYLSSVWMSGYGPAADATGNVYFVTSNSDPVHDVYDGVTDIQESVVKLSPNLATLESIFTPSDEFSLDQRDEDYGAGGVLLLPPQPGAIPNLAAAAGKEGTLFLLNQKSLGGFDPNNSGIVTEVDIGKCYCGQSYFNDGVGHVVSSGEYTVNLWTVETSPQVALINAGSRFLESTAQSPGFFTSISSSGANNAVIWAVSRPKSTTNTAVTLYALSATPSNGKLPVLFRATAGSWPNLGANANIVPVVANGLVYVASYEQLSIFGLLPPGVAPATIKPQPATQSVLAPGQHELFGTVTAIEDSRFTLQTRTGGFVQVDATSAIQNELSIDLFVSEAVDARGIFDSNGVLRATVIQKAKKPATWPPDI